MKSIWFINHYASTPTCGFGGRTYYFAKKLGERGFETKLIISNPHHLLRTNIEQSSTIFEQNLDGVNLVTIKGLTYQSAHSFKRILNWFVFNLNLKGLVKKYKDNPPDVIFCSSPSIVSTSGARYLSKKFGAKLVIDIRDIWPLTLVELGGASKHNLLIRLLNLYEVKAYKNAQLITSNLKNFSQYLSEIGFGNSNFQWLPNGYDESEYEQESSQARSDNFIVGYTGTFGLANSLFPLLEAARLLKSHPDIGFVFVGEGRELEDMKSFCKTHNLQNVQFKDFVPKSEIQRVLSSFDLLTVGARRSNLYRYGVSPNKLFDYFNAAKPILYYIDSPGFNPITDSRSGIEVPSGAPEELAEAILQIKALPRIERERMGMRGRAFAKRHFEYSALTDRLVDILKSLS